MRGISIVMVPGSSGKPTEEDPSATAAERQRRFGQTDNIRLYGDHLETRLHDGGLDVVVPMVQELFLTILNGHGSPSVNSGHGEAALTCY